MEQDKTENKMEDKAIENKIVHIHKTTEFGGRKFIIDERVVNKCINLISCLDTTNGYTALDKAKEQSIELLQSMQENEHHETKEI